MSDKVIAERLRHLRRIYDLTQADVAKGLAIAPNAYNFYENEKRGVPSKTMIQLADFFGVSLDYLVGRSNDPQIEFFCNKAEEMLEDELKSIDLWPKDPNITASAHNILSFYAPGFKPSRIVVSEMIRDFYLTKKNETTAPQDRLNFVFVVRKMLSPKIIKNMYSSE